MTPRSRTRGVSFIDELVLSIEDGLKIETRRVAGRESECKRCPYGKPGDHLYVRQTYRVTHMHGPHPNEPRRSAVHMRYRARGEGKVILYAKESIAQAHRALGTAWRPPMFMPRWAARTFLEIEETCLEPIQEITPEAIRREGLDRPAGSDTGLVDNFIELWDKINAPRGYGWESNPMCWVLRFRAVPRPERSP
jgi:hypothetical protein